jgi:hypothetical protein
MFGIYEKTFNIIKMININSFSPCALWLMNRSG